MPAFYPRIRPRRFSRRQLECPEELNTSATSTAAVGLTTFRSSPSDVIDKYEVYLGFQTSAEELDHNRASSREPRWSVATPGPG